MTSLRGRVPGRGPGRRLLVPAVVIALTAAVPVALGSATSDQPTLAAPTGLQTFQLRLGLPTTGATSFWRTPSFKWRPVRGAAGYRFELGTSPGFRTAGDVIWSTRTSSTPAMTIPLSLPWVTGASLYWHVRVISGNGTSPWSRAASFKMRSDRVPQTLAEGPGYVRWSAVRGATGYDVWFVNLQKVISTTTTVADLRDYSTSADVVWRVRANRRLYGISQPGLLPAVSHGPWSKTYTSRATLGSPPLLTTVPGSTSGPMPALLFPAKDAELHHVYITSDSACTKVVFNSAVISGGAFAPRSHQLGWTSGATIAPNNGPVFTKSGAKIRPSEAAPSSAPGESARVDLPDGRYFWTVVAVERRAGNSYHDLASPASACREAKGIFSKGSGRPVVATPLAPYATGLSPLGRLLSAALSSKRFYGFPVVTWKSVPGATQYEIQWSHTTDPWRQAGTLKTYATSALLPLEPGAWWYRVRGIDTVIPGNEKLTWSARARVNIAAPTFSVTRG